MAKRSPTARPEAIRNDPKVIAAYLGVEEDEVADGEIEMR